MKATALLTGALAASLLAATSALGEDLRPHILIRTAQGYEASNLDEVALSKMPLCIRYENYWCLKSAGWNGEIGKDERNHAKFDDPKMGARAFVVLMKNYRFKHKLKSANQIIARYAPADDCVGSIGTPQDCKFGPNPTADYAKAISGAAGKTPEEDLGIFSDDGRIDLAVAIPVFRKFAQYEFDAKYSVTDDLIRLGVEAAGLTPTQP